MNLSLGGYYGSTCSTNSSYKTSVTSVANGGTRVAIASGNNNANAAYYQPGCLNGTNIYTVTNMRCNKTYYNDATYGGNYGRPPVDYIATGTSVYSTYLNGGYATLTGTSMATPHVAGIMHVRQAAPATNGNVTYNSVSYPIAVK
jgi:subtilisin family serine protease